MHVLRLILVGMVALAAACSQGGDGPAGTCDPGELQAALSAASAGDTVRVGACRVPASVTVPPGVTLQGEGADVSIFVLAEGSEPITLQPGDAPTTLRDVSVESSAPIGVEAEGAGQVALTQVTIRAAKGVALGVEDLDLLQLAELTLIGPVVDETRAEQLVPPFDGRDVATHGLVVVGVGDAQLSNVMATGFGQFGVLLVESTTTWTGGGAIGNLGTGLMVHGGAAQLSGLDLSETLEGVLLIPAYGAVFAADAQVETTALHVSDGDGFGLLHAGVTARHLDLQAHNNDAAAVWIQGCDGVELSGAGTGLIGNGLAGLVAVESRGITMRHAHVDGTIMQTTVVGETGSVAVGDGIQLVDTTEEVLLENLTMLGNQRVGLLLDVGAADITGIALNEISIDGSDDQLGALAQGVAVPAGWDANITRQGATLANDAAFADTLGVVGIVGPSDLPAAQAVAENGLAEFRH